MLFVISQLETTANCLEGFHTNLSKYKAGFHRHVQGLLNLVDEHCPTLVRDTLYWSASVDLKMQHQVLFQGVTLTVQLLFDREMVPEFESILVGLYPYIFQLGVEAGFDGSLKESVVHE